MVYKVLLDLLDLKVYKVYLVRLEELAHKVFREMLALQDHKVFKVQEEIKGFKVTQVLMEEKVLLDQQDRGRPRGRRPQSRHCCGEKRREGRRREGESVLTVPPTVSHSPEKGALSKHRCAITFFN